MDIAYRISPINKCRYSDNLRNYIRMCRWTKAFRSGLSCNSSRHDLSDGVRYVFGDLFSHSYCEHSIRVDRNYGDTCCI